MAVAVVCGFEISPTSPPASRTLPVPSSVVVLETRHSMVNMQAGSPALALDHWPVAGWYSSANVWALPVTSTSPSGSKVPMLVPWALIMLPVAVNFPVAGLYSSAAVVAPVPPAMSTWPLFSRAALCPARAVVMLPVRDHMPVAGLYSSALDRRSKFASSPPATSTWPSGSRVADGSAPASRQQPVRPWCMLPVTDQVPVAGLYSSALDRTIVPVTEVPPATSTWPSGSNVAVAPARGMFIWPVTAQVPVVGL